ncbi:hypothetical protein F511_33097 [Dorcoceras hygrometricum]|uniref:Uncharacterized protein n=1 Tax=Dorcoceras hygrometricum TaxID=472368 RepID=A0A2Z7AXV4_9LAMI|nr:hypothetical protein F511_33097 [Dorcoceras hygrometricum]
MRTRSEKRPNRKNDRKVFVAEESNKNWADSDSDSTSSSSTSSDSEPEEVHCLMEDQTTTEDEVFDFSNCEFTREDLINALNEMVHEYRKLSQTFEEIKAENKGLKNSSIESSNAQLEDTDSLKTELSKLMIVNDLLGNISCELKSENERLNEVMSSWTKSAVSLSKLHETQKPLNDKSGLGFCVGESSSEGTSTQSDLAYDKFKTMNFVKASVIHNAYESVKYDDQTSGQLNQKGKAVLAKVADPDPVSRGRLAPTKFVGNLALHDDRNKSDHDDGGGAARRGGAWRSGGGREVEEGGGGARKSHSLKSSSYDQHIELSFRAGIMIQYLCDPQWFRNTASRGPTTIVTPKSQFRTCPSDHGKAPSNIAP